MSIVEKFKNGELDSKNPVHEDLEEFEEEKLHTYGIICPHCHEETTAQATEYGMPSKCSGCSQPIWLHQKTENFSLEEFLRNAKIINKISLIACISQLAAQIVCGLMIFFMDFLYMESENVFPVFIVWTLINFVAILVQLIFLSFENKMGWSLIPLWLAEPFSSYVETTTTTVLFIPVYRSKKDITKYKYELLPYLFKVMTGEERISDKPDEGTPMYSYVILFFLNALFAGITISLYQKNETGMSGTLIAMAIWAILFALFARVIYIEHIKTVTDASLIASMLPEKITIRTNQENK